MEVNLAELQQLFENTDGAMPWSEVVPALEYWQRVASGEAPPLKPASEIDVDAYVAALRRVTHPNALFHCAQPKYTSADLEKEEETECFEPIVALLSLSDPYPRPIWASKEGYVNGRFTTVMSSLCGHLGCPLVILLHHFNGRHDTIEAHQVTLQTSLTSPLHEALCKSLATPMMNVAMNHIWDFRKIIFRGILFLIPLVIACALEGDEEDFGTLSDLLRAQEGTLSIGFGRKEEGEPYTFIAICA